MEKETTEHLVYPITLFQDKEGEINFSEGYTAIPKDSVKGLSCKVSKGVIGILRSSPEQSSNQLSKILNQGISLPQ